MINIDSFKQFFDFISNKNERGTTSPSRFNIAVERALVEWTMEMYGNDKEYQPGRPIPRVAYEQTQKVTDDLRHLIETRDFIVPTTGRITIPDGTATDASNQVMPEYLHFSSLRAYYSTIENGVTSTIERDVTLISDDELGRYLTSKIVGPSEKHPIGKEYSTYIEIWPKTHKRVRLTYLRQPNTPEWAYTTVNGRPVYDAANSTDVDAPKEAFNAIAINALSFLGIHLREPELLQYTSQQKVEGV